MDDRLTEIVTKQKEIMARFFDADTMTLEQKEVKAQELLLAIMAEIGEVLNGQHDGENVESGKKGSGGAIRWKSWKTNVQPPDLNYVKSEVTDILFFTLELLILFGADANEIFERYMAKHKVNIKRYDNGY
jgi:NTP pyrophosphatase (non-canonical NTP hydrolase)